MIKKKKLLIATDNFLPRWDGIARFLSKVIPTLSKNYDITVLGPDFGKFKSSEYRLVRIKSSRWGLGDYVAPKIAFRTVRREVKRADIVFAQTIGPIGFLAILFAKKNNVKVASFIHSLEWELIPMATDNMLLRRFLYPLAKFFTRFIYNKPDLLIAPSHLLVEAFTWRGIHTKKRVARLGVDCDTFKPMYERSENELETIENLREDLGLNDAFVIGNHGRVANEKDLITLLRAFNIFKKKHKNAKLLIIGDGVKSIKHVLEKNEDCILPGSKNDVQLYLNLIDLYVTSSLTETTSLTTLEAMASGLPVISTPVGFIKEYIKRDVNGVFFKPKNSFELYHKLNMLKKDSKKASKMGVNARKTVFTNFQWSDTANSISEILQEL